MDFLANIVCLLSVNVLGKRVLCLLAVFASGVCCFILSKMEQFCFINFVRKTKDGFFYVFVIHKLYCWFINFKHVFERVVVACGLHLLFIT